ncbi:MAG: hypothetical protein Q8N69_03240 [bacterium]|nr:hypothetical protein [bacterium]
MQKTYFKYLLSLIIIVLLFSSVSFVSAQSQPDILRDANEAKGVLKTILEAIPGIYHKHIYPYGKMVWDKASYYLNKEVEKRKPVAKEEFNKEVEELKEEAATYAPSIWRRLLDLIY